MLHSPARKTVLFQKTSLVFHRLRPPSLNCPKLLDSLLRPLNVRVGKSDLRRIGKIVWMLENKTKEILSIAPQPALVINVMVFTAEAQ
jgi:hypothetical protein